MRRRVFTVAVAGSSLLCAMALVLWIRSYWHADYLYYSVSRETGLPYLKVDETSHGVLVWRGVVQCDSIHHGMLHRSAENGDGWHAHASDHWDWGSVDLHDHTGENLLQFMPLMLPTSIGVREPQEKWGSFGFNRDSFSPSGWNAPPLPVRFCTSVFFPVWSLVLLSGVLPSCWLFGTARAGARAHRARKGICPVCSYDLRASTTRCPECGTPIKSKREHEIHPT